MITDDPWDKFLAFRTILLYFIGLYVISSFLHIQDMHTYCVESCAKEVAYEALVKTQNYLGVKYRLSVMYWMKM